MLDSWINRITKKRLGSFLILAVLCYGFLYIKQPTQHMVGVSGDGFQMVPMENCNCSRLIPINPNYLTIPELNSSKKIQYNETTCSVDSFMRGANQNIVGYSFYGDIKASVAKKKGYFEGIKGNLELLPTFYPGWIMRVYFDLHPKDPVLVDLCDLACKNPLLDVCHVRHLPGTPMVDAAKVFAMNWRFFPTLDPQVDGYACRDLDSRLSAREAAAVDEWLHKSDEPIHAMRDHPAHVTSLLGASWGTILSRKNARGRWKKAWKKMLRDKKTWAPRNSKGPDQAILDRYIWKTFGRHMAIQHDSYLCESYPGGIPWPTQRLMEPNNFVASVVMENATLIKKCPKKCRPKDHQDWEYC